MLNFIAKGLKSKINVSILCVYQIYLYNSPEKVIFYFDNFTIKNGKIEHSELIPNIG